MNFLEAHRLATAFTGPTRDLRVALSGVGEPLTVYLRAAGAWRGVGLAPTFLPFNTLAQHLHTPADGTDEVYFLLPWDLAPELDWRSGIPQDADPAAVLDRAEGMAALVARRRAPVVYLPAPVPPIFPEAARVDALAMRLRALAAGLGAAELPAETFSMASYLGTGVPVAGASHGQAATALVEAALHVRREPAKVIVTDLDNVMWDGVVAEDGLDGIHYGSHGAGYKHFLYQTLLARLKREGIVLAAVSRNDPEVALGPFKTGRMVLKEQDFVAIVASYNAKSVQVAALADQLNLGLDAFVFVDDNEVELTEMSLKLPQVRCERFIPRDDALPALLARVSAHFDGRTITAEDREKTEMYRRRLAGMVPSDAQGADLRAFLESLEMSLVLHDRSSGDRTRAVQLINKTSQFNINGRRVTDEEVGAVLDAGGALYTAALEDRNGSHGEILALLVDTGGVVRSFVMSCRVFNRRVEFAFLHWLARSGRRLNAFDVAATERNLPARTFLGAAAFRPAGADRLEFDAARFVEENADAETLFRLVQP